MKLLAKSIYVSIFFITFICYGQQLNDNSVYKGKIKKLNFLFGEWDGNAKIRFSPTEEYPFTIHESASYKLDSTAFYIEGIAKIDIGGEERIVGQGLGIITYDLKANEYRMLHCEANGATFSAPVTIENNKMDYYSTDSNGLKLHVKINVGKDGVWTETVDKYEEGKGWQLFREYTVQRIK